MVMDEYRKEQAEYMEKCRAKQRALKIEIEKKQISASLMPREAYNTLKDAMRAKKAKIQVIKLRDEKERQKEVKNDVSSILNSIIDAVPIKSKNKKNSEAVARRKDGKN
jgi:hypothetical protein